MAPTPGAALHRFVHGFEQVNRTFVSPSWLDTHNFLEPQMAKNDDVKRVRKHVKVKQSNLGRRSAKPRFSLSQKTSEIILSATNISHVAFHITLSFTLSKPIRLHSWPFPISFVDKTNLGWDGGRLLAITR